MTRLLRRRLAGLLAAVLCSAAALAAGPVAPAAAGSAAATRPARVASAAGLAAQVAARPGTNLLLNPGAQAGAASAEGWDAVTIPGWRVSAGLPTVVPYGAPDLAPATGHWPAVHGGSLPAAPPPARSREERRAPG